MARRGRPGMGFGSGPMMRGGRRVGEQRIGAVARQRLAEAHELEGRGEHATAAARFREVAGICRDRGLSRMATTLSAKAARCFARVGDEQGFVGATEAAIGDARLEADPQHAARTFGELLAGLEGTKFAGGRDALDAAIRSAVGIAPALPAAAGEVNRNQRRTVPEECEHCGAGLASVALRFNDDGSADCPFCGSVLTA